jgi:hypothetical protein
MSVDPAVAAAANTYLSLPMNFGEPTNLILIAEKDAWVAAVEWLVGHPDVYARLSRQKPPTDDEREALARIIHADDIKHGRAHDDFWLMNEESSGWYHDNAAAVLAAGYRRQVSS